ncbi:MAG: aquaporin family protein [Actinobacteria bacterium]|jgi:glycerol uptake facilitator-like aquaporin|nr:aquaporin family protein [Actinomycetota bacterium]NCV42083.1 aquaporin family protein [Actinomycetota bacterium]NCV82163.1 aquaporin family protein [Actinomycetota bacterium]NCW43736.1 aquaporin family protein [Actinomycetota bacterium]NCW72659.1 aquaporin family protein [Actinomycetota bacterium]
MYPAIMKKVFAEFLGTAFLVAIVVGSGIMATNLSQDVGVQLLINTISTVFGLYVLITILAPISGAHFNPVVTMVDLIEGKSATVQFIQYIFAQALGAITGAMLANAMFSYPLLEASTKIRSGGNLYIGEIVATAGLILLINLLVNQKNLVVIPAAVAAWIGSAYFFTSSTSFANPAVTIGRTFSDSFAGIAPECAPKFIAAQVLGALIGLGLAKVLTREK